MEEYALIVGIVSVASLSLAFLISAKKQHPISSTVLHLAETAWLVSQEKDYSARATPSAAADELTVLTKTFNAMLMQIEQRDQALQNARRDVEQQVQTRTAELRKSEEQYRLLFDQVPLPLFVYDLGNLSFLAVNKAAVTHYGYSPEEFAAMKLDDIRPAEEFAALHEHLEKVRSKDFAVRVSRHRKKDGTLFDAETHSFRSRLGDRPSMIVLVMDVTEQRRIEERIRTLNQDLEARVVELAATNKDLEAFTYSVSHDLRAPLRHIDGFSRILEDEAGAALDASCRRHLQRIREGTRQMGTLVDDLLSLSRIGRQEVRRQACGLGQLVQEVRSELQRETAERQVEWRIGALPFADADPALLKQVLTNLLSNAVKYTRPRERAVIEVGAIEESGEPVVFVRDNGVGFSMKYADKLFGVFQRLHRQEDFEGTGVGLATVQRIIQKHGGRIWAEAELDHGACFYFTLGVAEATMPAPATPLRPAAVG